MKINLTTVQALSVYTLHQLFVQDNIICNFLQKKFLQGLQKVLRKVNHVCELLHQILFILLTKL